MKHRLLLVVLAFGTVAGFASGFRSMHHHHHRRAYFERHIARVCVDAARGLDQDAAESPGARRHARGHRGATPEHFAAQVVAPGIASQVAPHVAPHVAPDIASQVAPHVAPNVASQVAPHVVSPPLAR